MLQDMAKASFRGMFSNLARSSRDRKLRVSLEFADVRKDTLITSDVEVLFEVGYFKELSEQYKKEREDSGEAANLKEAVFSDIHNFETLLTCAAVAGWKVQETPDSEVVLVDLPYTSNIYDVDILEGASFDVFADRVFKECKGSELISFLIFLAYHVEFYI